jgi:charged multivesicular body protein 5
LKDNLDTIHAMKQSTEMMKKQFKNYDIDKIYDLQDEMSDMMLDAEGSFFKFNFLEINDLMSRNYASKLT